MLSFSPDTHGTLWFSYALVRRIPFLVRSVMSSIFDHSVLGGVLPSPVRHSTQSLNSGLSLVRLRSDKVEQVAVITEEVCACVCVSETRQNTPTLLLSLL